VFCSSKTDEVTTVFHADHGLSSHGSNTWESDEGLHKDSGFLDPDIKAIHSAIAHRYLPPVRLQSTKSIFLPFHHGTISGGGLARPVNHRSWRPIRSSSGLPVRSPSRNPVRSPSGIPVRLQRCYYLR